LKTSTILMIVVGIAILLIVTGYINLPSGIPAAGNVYSGRVKVNLVQLKRIDGTAYEVINTQMRVIHGSMDYNDKVGTLASNTITGDLKSEDKGYWYLILDYATNNTEWLDSSETLKDPYVTRCFGADGDRDGFDEEYVELYFGNLGALVAGESYKEVEVSLIYDPARTSSIAFTSLTNASSIGTASFSYFTQTGYTTGVTEGDLFKIAKIQLSPDNATTGNMFDNGSFSLVHLKLGPYTWTATDFGGFDLANDRFKLEFGDQINSQGGKDVYYPKNGGDIWCPFELKTYDKAGAAAQTYALTINIYVYKPDGSVSSAFARIVSFAS